MKAGSHSLPHQRPLPSQLAIYPSYVKLSIDADHDDDDDDDGDDDDDDDDQRKRKRTPLTIFLISETLPSIHRWHYHRGEEGFLVSKQK